MAESLGSQVVMQLLRRWWIIVTVAAVSGGVAYWYANTMPVYYKATINCVPPRPDNSGLTGAMGGISSTLKDFGLTKLGGKSSDTYEFVVLFYARSLRDSLIKKYNLAQEYNMVGKPKDEVRDAFAENIEIDYKAEGNYEISVWDQDKYKAVEITKDVVEQANNLANWIQHQEAIKSSEYLEKRIASMDSTLTALQDTLTMYGNKYMIFSPPDQAKAAALSLATSQEQVLTEEAALKYMERYYGANDATVKAQRTIVEALKEKVRDVKTKPGFVGDLPVSEMTGKGISYMRAYAQFEAYSKLKAFLLPTLEQYKLDINKATVSLLIIDEPQPAEKKDRPKRGLIAAGAAFGMGVTTILVILLSMAFRRAYKQNNQQRVEPVTPNAA